MLGSRYGPSEKNEDLLLLWHNLHAAAINPKCVWVKYNKPISFPVFAATDDGQ